MVVRAADEIGREGEDWTGLDSTDEKDSTRQDSAGQVRTGPSRRKQGLDRIG